MNNKYFQDNLLNPPKIIYKEAQLIKTIKESVEFYFFKGRRIYTASELNIIELISHCGRRGIMSEICGNFTERSVYLLSLMT